MKRYQVNSEIGSDLESPTEQDSQKWKWFKELAKKFPDKYRIEFIPKYNGLEVNLLEEKIRGCFEYYETFWGELDSIFWKRW